MDNTVDAINAWEQFRVDPFSILQSILERAML